MRLSRGPQHNRPSSVHFSEDDSRRVRALIVAVGSIAEARERLGLGVHSFAAAREQGRVQRETYERFRRALDDAEAAL